MFDFEYKRLEADFDLLCIVLQNFLFNAIDAIEDGDSDNGVIEFYYFNDSNNAIFRIFDSGKPIENPQILLNLLKPRNLRVMA